MSNFHFFIYAIWLAGKWCKFGVSRGGESVTVVDWDNGLGWDVGNYSDAVSDCSPPPCKLSSCSANLGISL